MATKTTKVRSKVRCNCKKCDGNWVDSRTRNKHYAVEERLRLEKSELKKSDKKEKKRHHIKDLRLRIPSSSISVKHQPVTSKSL